ncbi:IS66 family transposase, partial [Paramuribaculum intestinale]|uniref:IS66 family transposase n=3 Tax=Bacteroidia TaxID=200643 RepID=UPI0025B6E089
MKTNRADIEFYREMMEHFQAESASKSAQVRAMQDEIAALRRENSVAKESHREDMELLRQSHREDIERLRKSHTEELEKMRLSFEKRLDRMAEANAGLAAQLGDALASGKLARAKKYARSSEQRNLLNNRKGVNRTEEENDSDGTPPADSGCQSADDAKNTKSRSKVRAKVKPEGKARFDEVVEHPMEENMVLPKGARLLPGEMWFEVIEYIPGRTVCHRYPYRRYILELPEDADKEAVFGDTLPSGIRARCPVDGCMLSASMIAFIMTQKYAYHLPQKRVRMMLRDMGAHIPRTTLNRFYMQGADALLAMLGETFREEMRKGGYFMIDETLQTVGVDNGELGRRYLNRYLWEFYNREKGLVEYVYEDGSRGQSVLKSFFDSDPETLEMLISCDGYNAYRLFDTEEYPGVTVVGCWTHARRNFIDALPSCRKPCEEMISMIGSLFENEAVCEELGFKEDGRLAYRNKRTKPVLDTIKAAADRMWNDPGLMAVGLLKKAVGYLRNQWDHLSNILKSGVPEISNNLSEQRVKPIKLSLKNCLNIGSEEAAKKHAFMHSLTES